MSLNGCDGKTAGEVCMNLACVGRNIPDCSEHGVGDGIVNRRCDCVCIWLSGALDILSELIQMAFGGCFGLGQVIADVLCRECGPGCEMVIFDSRYPSGRSGTETSGMEES